MIIETHKSNICRVGLQAGDPGELMFQFEFICSRQSGGEYSCLGELVFLFGIGLQLIE